MPTATQVPPTSNLEWIGIAPPDMPMHITVALKLRNEDKLDAFIAALGRPESAAFGAKLSAEDFAEAYSPTSGQSGAVVAYLSSAGFSSIKVSGNRLLVEADGTGATVAAAFHTAIGRYRAKGIERFSNMSPAFVPDAIGNVVSAVLGLQNISLAHFDGGSSARSPEAKASGSALPPPLARYLVPPEAQLTYHAMSTPTASKTVGAIIMFRDVSLVLKDLRAAQAMNNQPQFPVEIRTAGGMTTPNGSNEEFTLDSQGAGGIAGTFEKMIWYVDASTLTDQTGGAPLPAAAINEWVTDDLAPVASMSIGECENLAQVDGTMATIDTVLKQAVAQGQTLFVSTGDSGAYCGVSSGQNVGVPAVAFPASSPYAIAVGGTNLSTFVDSAYGTELGWSGSGGGYSTLEQAPTWQSGVAAAVTNGRAVPDISMVSVPGVVTIYNGSVNSVGGTSAAAPLAMGAWARIESANGNRLGFAAPYFYALEAAGVRSGDYSSTLTGFKDITQDDTAGPSNQVYHTSVGYDLVTGIGSIDICRLAGLLEPAGHPNYCADASSPAPGISTPVTSGALAASCTVPGITLPGVTSGFGYLTSIAIAEPFDQPGKIVFTLTVPAQSSYPANVTYQIRFARADGQMYYVEMDTANGSTSPAFTYGIVADNRSELVALGRLEAGSSASAADGVITLVADKTLFGTLVPLTHLAYIAAYADGLNGLPIGVGTSIKSDSTTASLYTLRTEETCVKSISTTPPAAPVNTERFGGAFGELLVMLLSMMQLVRMYRVKSRFK